MSRGYEEYKKTDLPWLKSIPSHWGYLRNKNVMTEQKDIVGKKSSKYTLLSLTLKGIVKRDLENAKGKFPKEFDSYKIVNAGNIVFCLFDIDETPRTVGLSIQNGMITGAYDVFEPNNNIINRFYLYYYYLSLDNIKALKPLYTGLRKVINPSSFKGIKLPVPPRSEQDQIVRYLDWKVSMINKYINAKKKQIELLREHRRAVINEAVTKEGKKYRLKTIVQEVSSKGSPKGNFYIGMENIISWKADFIETPLIAKGDCKTFSVGDILFGKLRPYLAKVYMPKEKGVCSGEFLVLRGFKGHLSYLKYLLLSYNFIMTVNASTYGAKMPRANWDFIGNYEFWIPSIAEQQKIASYLDKQCEYIDKLVEQSESEINLLNEYRTRLISDVVTGRVDVRGVRVPEYQVMEEVAGENEAAGDEGI